MSVYNSDQTGPKIQLGGAKDGRVRVTYHTGSAPKVKNEPMTPASCARRIQTKSVLHS